MLLSIIIAVLCAAAIYIAYRKKNYERKTNIRFMPLASTLSMLFSKEGLVEGTFKFIEHHKYPGFVAYWLGNIPVFLACDPNSAQWVLMQKDTVIQKASKISFEGPFKGLAYSLFNASGDDWKRARKAFAPAFNKNAYEMYHTVFINKINKTMGILSNKQGDVEIGHVLSSMTLDILGKTVLSYEFDSLDNRSNEAFEAYKTTVTPDAFRTLAFVFPFIYNFPIAPAKRLKEAVNTLQTTFRNLVEEEKKRRNSPDAKQTNTILGMLLDAHLSTDPSLHINETELLSNLFFTFLAGHDTTALALSWQLYELAIRPELQQKLYDEIKTKIGNQEPTVTNLEDLTQLSNFVQEALRMHPPVYNTLHRGVAQDLVYNNQHIPKGALIMVNSYSVQRHPGYWTDPDKFDPDRWNDAPAKHRFANLPFSLGPRMCLGNNFALIEMQSFLVQFLKIFKVLPGKEHKLSDKTTNSMLNKMDSCWVYLEKRNTSAQ